MQNWSLLNAQACFWWETTDALGAEGSKTAFLLTSPGGYPSSQGSQFPVSCPGWPVGCGQMAGGNGGKPQQNPWVWGCGKTLEFGIRSAEQDKNLDFVTDQLCDLGEVTLLLWALVSLFGK